MRLAFNGIKEGLLKNVVLDIPNPLKQYVLECDACDYAVGGVLSQEDPEGNSRPVAFFSRKLQGEPGKGQWAWSIREKETYAIVLCLQKFRSWLASSAVKIKVLTDHQSLQHWHTEDLNSMLGCSTRRAHWHEFLSMFNLEVVYVPGEQHSVSDPLSRWAYPAGVGVQDYSLHGDKLATEHAHQCDLEEHHYDDFPVSLVNGPFLLPNPVVVVETTLAPLATEETLGKEAPVFMILTDSWDYSKSVWKDEAENLAVGNNIPGYNLDQYGHVFHEHKVCVPAEITLALLEYYHQFGHPGGEKTLWHCYPEI